MRAVCSLPLTASIASAKKTPVPKLIACDVDGTLLNSAHKLTEANVNAILKAKENDIRFCLATGKAWGPWLPEVQEKLQLQDPCLFLNGLYVCDMSGNVLWEQRMEENVAMRAADLANEHGLTLTAYCGDRILCEEVNDQTDRLLPYKEPTPEAVGVLSSAFKDILPHKCILMGEPDGIDSLRPTVEKEFEGVASITIAIPGFLEVLPLGASKAKSLRWLLGQLSIKEEEVLAFGDGENDLEMLQMAGIGVAMANAKDIVKSVANSTTLSNDEGGVAHGIQMHVLDQLAPAR